MTMNNATTPFWLELEMQAVRFLVLWSASRRNVVCPEGMHSWKSSRNHSRLQGVINVPLWGDFLMAGLLPPLPEVSASTGKTRAKKTDDDLDGTQQFGKPLDYLRQDVTC